MNYKETTELLATNPLNETEAHILRTRFMGCSAWENLVDCFPGFERAIKELPNVSALLKCNIIMREMVIGEMKRFGFLNPAHQYSQ